MGPEPKKPMQPHFAFQTKKSAEIREESKEMKVTEASAKAAAIWKEMDEKAREPYIKAHADGMKDYEKKMAEREKKGYFTFEDGSKSTDPKNKDRVKQPKKSKGKKGEESESEDEKLMPKKVNSAYTIFIQEFKVPEGEDKKNLMTLAGAAWKKLSDEEK